MVKVWKFESESEAESVSSEISVNDDDEAENIQSEGNLFSVNLEWVILKCATTHNSPQPPKIIKSQNLPYAL